MNELINAMAGELIADVDPAFVREFSGHILGTIPEEKIKCELRQVRNARVMRAAGSVCIEDLGQKIASIDPRLYFRAQASFAQSPDDTDWIEDLIRDNPMCRAPGYNPPQKGTRHGITFVEGKPIGHGPHSEKQT